MTTSISSEAQKLWIELSENFSRLSKLGIEKKLNTQNTRNRSSTPTYKQISMKLYGSVQNLNLFTVIPVNFRLLS